jgi:hypothetical protein
MTHVDENNGVSSQMRKGRYLRICSYAVTSNFSLISAVCMSGSIFAVHWSRRRYMVDRFNQTCWRERPDESGTASGLTGDQVGPINRVGGDSRPPDITARGTIFQSICRRASSLHLGVKAALR